MLKDILKTLPQYILPKQGITHLAGLLAATSQPQLKNWCIDNFIQCYGVNMQEALEENPKNYATFNDFFIRHLKPELRPLSDEAIVSPVDGVISELGPLEQGQLIQAKGKYYTVEELLACSSEEAKPFQQGLFATLYLAPKDYHRIHMPIDAQLKKMIYVPGSLFSVQPSTAKVIPKLFARNQRLCVYFDTALGEMVMILVGATIVGAIGTAWAGEVRSKQLSITEYSAPYRSFQKGEEMGYFKLGSTVVLLFANNQSESISWLPELKAESSLRFGEGLGIT